MPLALTLRRRKEVSPFLRHLCRLMTAPAGDTAWLCSGSFQEEIAGEASLVAALKHANAPKKIVLVGGMFWGPQGPKNRKQFDALRKRLSGLGLTVSAYVAKDDSWHSKIALRVRGEQPTAALIGSSNLTKPALLEGLTYWNFESDVAIWLEELDGYFRPRDREVAEEEYALLQFDPAEKRREPDRLKDLLLMLKSLIEDKVLKDADSDEFDIDSLGL